MRWTRLLAPTRRTGNLARRRIGRPAPITKEEIGNLLNDFQRVGNPARREGIPYLINLTADLTGKHRFSGESDNATPDRGLLHRRDGNLANSEQQSRSRYI
jgi:hypothetical protein